MTQPNKPKEKQKYDTVNEYFKHHHKKVGRFHTVATTTHPQKWIAYGSTDYKKYAERGIKNPYHREVLPNEVVIDIDAKEPKVRDEALKQILTKLDGVNYSVWKTGGKGVHIHLYFKQLQKMSASDRKEMKRIIIHHYCYGLIEKADIDMQLCSRHMVRAEFGRHEKTGRYKKLQSANNELELNNIPSTVTERFIKRKKEQREWKPPTKVDNGITPDCVRFLLSEDFRGVGDGRKRALFVLASWYKAQGLMPEEAVPKLMKWNHYHCLDKLSNTSIETTFRGTNGSMSCRGRHDLLRSLGRKDIAEQCKEKNENRLEELK